MAGEVAIKVTAETEQAQKALDQTAEAVKKLEEASKGTSGAVKDLGGALSQGAEVAAKAANEEIAALGESVGVSGRALGFLAENALLVGGVLGVGLVAAAGYAGKKLYDATQEALSLGQSLNRLSQQTGVSAEVLSGFSLVAATSSTNIEQFAHGLEALARKVADAQREGKEASNIFTQLGISIKEPSGRVKDLSDLFLEISDKMAGYADGANKTALMSELFGRALGVALIPMVNQGSAGIQRLREEAEKAGRIMSGDVARAADEFSNSMKVLNAYTGAFWRELAGPVVIALAEIATSMRQARVEGEGFLGAIGAGITTLTRLVMFGSEEGQLKALVKRVAELHSEMNKLREGRPVEGAADPTGGVAIIRGRIDAQIKQREAELSAITERMERLRAFVSPTGETPARPAAPVTTRGKTRTEHLRDEVADAQQEIKKLTAYWVESGQITSEEYQSVLENMLEVTRTRKGQTVEIAQATGQKEQAIRHRIADDEIALEAAIQKVKEKRQASDLKAMDEEIKKDKEHDERLLQNKLDYINRRLEADAEAAAWGVSQDRLSEERRTQLLMQRDQTEDQIHKNALARIKVEYREQEQYMEQEGRNLKDLDKIYVQQAESEIQRIKKEGAEKRLSNDEIRSQILGLLPTYDSLGEHGASAHKVIQKAAKDTKTTNEELALEISKVFYDPAKAVVEIFQGMYKATSQHIANFLKGNESAGQAIQAIWHNVGDELINIFAKSVATAIWQPVVDELKPHLAIIQGLFKELASFLMGLFKPVFSAIFGGISEAIGGAIAKTATAEAVAGSAAASAAAGGASGGGILSAVTSAIGNIFGGGGAAAGASEAAGAAAYGISGAGAGAGVAAGTASIMPFLGPAAAIAIFAGLVSGWGQSSNTTKEEVKWWMDSFKAANPWASDADAFQWYAARGAPDPDRSQPGSVFSSSSELMAWVQSQHNARFNASAASYQHGGEFLVSRPTLFSAGEVGPEKVSVQPMAGFAGQGGRGVHITFNGPFVTDSYGMKLFLREQQRLVERGGFA